MTVSVREATGEELPAVLNVLDGAVLSVDVETVREGIAGDGTLVAVTGSEAGGGRVLGALVLDGTHIDAVAVRRRRRGQGIGTALVRDAIDRRNEITAEFDADVRPFYEALGFDVTPLEESGRYWGKRG